VTIQFTEGTQQFRRAQMVAVNFAPPSGKPSDQRTFISISDFTVAVIKREPQALTLFFSNDETALMVLEHLPQQIEAGTLGIIPCDPARVCGGTVSFVGSWTSR